MSIGEYCRAVESFLCRKNDGHLIRVVGPAFEMVCDWERTGIPLGIIERAIEKRHLRYTADGARRRPLRIEFCEGDVLELFDQWRRAVGAPQVTEQHTCGVSVASESDSDNEKSSSRTTLPAHLDGVIQRLQFWSESRPPDCNDSELLRRVSKVVEFVSNCRKSANGLRGNARQEVIVKLKQFDEELLVTIRATADQILMQRLESEARASLEPFRSRMAAEAFENAVTIATNRLLANHFKIPSLSFD